MSNQNREQVAVWGTGKVGRCFYYKHRNELDVKFFIDNYPKRNQIDNIPVITPEHMDSDIKIIIAVADYFDICNQCESMGKQFIVDYFPYDFYEENQISFVFLHRLFRIEKVKEIIRKANLIKRTIVIIGNCQTQMIKKMLFASNAFKKDYILIDIPPIYECDDTMVGLFEQVELFKTVSLILSQNISKNNGYTDLLSTEIVKKQRGEKTKIVIIPTLYFDVYFPQTIHQSCSNYFLKEVGITSYPYGDWLLDELSKKYQYQDVCEIVEIDNLFDKTLMGRIKEYRFAELKHREEQCNITIVDFIEKNYKTQQLFYCKNHPNNNLLSELTRRILASLGYFDYVYISSRYTEMDQYSEAIYPSVYKALQLDFPIRGYKDVLYGGMNLSGFVKNYILAKCSR